jgi:hypothetical protein
LIVQKPSTTRPHQPLNQRALHELLPAAPIAHTTPPPPPEPLTLLPPNGQAQENAHAKAISFYKQALTKECATIKEEKAIKESMNKLINQH